MDRLESVAGTPCSLVSARVGLLHEILKRVSVFGRLSVRHTYDIVDELIDKVFHHLAVQHLLFPRVCQHDVYIDLRTRLAARHLYGIDQVIFPLHDAPVICHGVRTKRDCETSLSPWHE
jgi:hypothetical protein